MNPPKAAVFDLGKVLLDFDYSIAARRIMKPGLMSEAEAHHYLAHSPVLVNYETGLITRQEFYDRVRRAAQFRGSIEEFSGQFADIFTEIPAMIELHAALRRRGVPTYIFSNTNDLAIQHIRNNFPFFAGFDGYIFSYEVKCMKPAPGIYENLEQLTGLRGADLLYLDDRPENIETGRQRGWRVILHETPEKSVAAVREAGLL
ncbi:MAG: HAD family phosphatase [Verrucomicrobiota bacterium]